MKQVFKSVLIQVKILATILLVGCSSPPSHTTPLIQQKFVKEHSALPDNEDDAAPVSKEYQIDLDVDGSAELVRVNYGPGVSDKYLTIDIFKDGKKVDTLEGRFGIQSNYVIKDADKDGKKEIIIWSGLWDPRMPGEDGLTEETYEGHSSPHRYAVATYKFIKGNEFRQDQYLLWDIYTTKKKHEPFCEPQPI